jgi:pimeloyl-ACP methyl ester carboxylesterase
MHVVLVHGLGRTPLSLVGLARELRRAGHRTELVGYLGAIEHYDAIVARVRRRLVAAAGARVPLAAIGHSLGGLVLRAALADWPAELPPPRGLLMLGTPQSPSRLARRFRHWRLYRWVNGECGQLLARAEFFAGLPAAQVPVTLVAGTRGWPGALVFGGEPNDGVVAVSEVRSAGGPEVAELPASHTFMMNNRRVRALVLEALARAESRAS